eukprot:CAMPEP_0182448790 /NCGR_PEP_ID=MMETSP1172-20130603/29904_1 /TAXON_ID=708627 /ORGANISM="Timspurckia oligopyrenoides, Strain CCMP3278" /LENGTH=69 /DNA_ID=CAMNT_0024645807 /DNA_START=479 /DNA_END=685 /DNA_ORIENTATION=-
MKTFIQSKSMNTVLEPIKFLITNWPSEPRSSQFAVSESERFDPQLTRSVELDHICNSDWLKNQIEAFDW